MAIALAAVTAGQGQAQQDPRTVTAAAAGAEEVLVELGGDVAVKSWNGDHVAVRVHDPAAARVAGRSRGSAAQVRVDREGGTLRVSRVRGGGLVSFLGLGRTQGDTRYEVMVPAGLKVRFRNVRANLEVEGPFRALSVENQEGSTAVRVQRGALGRLLAESRTGTVTVGGTPQGSRYETTGGGQPPYAIRSNRGAIRVQIF